MLGRKCRLRNHAGHRIATVAMKISRLCHCGSRRLATAATTKPTKINGAVTLPSRLETAAASPPTNKSRWAAARTIATVLAITATALSPNPANLTGDAAAANLAPICVEQRQGQANWPSQRRGGAPSAARRSRPMPAGVCRSGKTCKKLHRARTKPPTGRIDWRDLLASHRSQVQHLPHRVTPSRPAHQPLRRAHRAFGKNRAVLG